MSASPEKEALIDSSQILAEKRILSIGDQTPRRALTTVDGAKNYRRLVT